MFNIYIGINMDLKYLKSIVEIFDKSKATELSITEDGIELYMSCTQEMPTIQQMPVYQAQPQVNSSPQIIKNEYNAAPIINEISTNEDANLHIIHSPMVGTFYRAPSPDSKNYCEVGSSVNKGDTLCIIEAMKLMNEIESDINGTIAKIYIENGQPVEFAQPLFAIKA